MARSLRVQAYASLFSEGVETTAWMSLTQRRLHREALLGESLPMRLAREALDVAHLLARPRGWPAALGCLQIAAEESFAGPPDPVSAVRHPDGLAGPARLCPHDAVDGYARGLILRGLMSRPTWWSPAMRHARPLLVEPRPAMRDDGFRLDEGFEEIAAACARAAVRRRDGGAPTPAMLDIFARLHDRGDAHCFELRSEAGLRIAGGWGVASGGVFVSQGAFENEIGALERCFYLLEAQLAQFGFTLHAPTAEIAAASRLSWPLLSRAAFLAHNANAGAGGRRGRWREERRLSAAA